MAGAVVVLVVFPHRQGRVSRKMEFFVDTASGRENMRAERSNKGFAGVAWDSWREAVSKLLVKDDSDSTRLNSGASSAAERDASPLSFAPVASPVSPEPISSSAFMTAVRI